MSKLILFTASPFYTSSPAGYRYSTFGLTVIIGSILYVFARTTGCNYILRTFIGDGFSCSNLAFSSIASFATASARASCGCSMALLTCTESHNFNFVLFSNVIYSRLSSLKQESIVLSSLIFACPSKCFGVNTFIVCRCIAAISCSLGEYSRS